MKFINAKFKYRIMSGGAEEYANSNYDKRNWNPWPIIILLTILSLLILCVVSQPALMQVFTNLFYRDQPDQTKEVDTVLSCYYTTPDLINATTPQLLPSHLNPHLCTHINVGFATVVNKEIYLDDAQYKTLKEVVKLKQSNPRLKVLLSVGGAGDKNGFSDMVANHTSRKIFIKSIKYILRNYSLDGVDLDWEFPALHLQDQIVGARERQHFSQLLREIRMEYIREKRDYILSVALAAPQPIVDVAYDVDQVNLYADFANIMTYDFHYYNKYTPFTGLNSPLYPRSSEGLYMATLNINYTVQMFVEKGLDRSKIVVGIPTYGHTFRLINPTNTNVGSPASGFGSLGGLGFVNYPDVCKYKKNTVGVTNKFDDDAQVPYLYSGTEWVSYDSPQSVKAKANFIKENKLRGAMIYSLNADDFEGSCEAEGVQAFPLAASVRNILPEKYPSREH